MTERQREDLAWERLRPLSAFEAVAQRLARHGAALALVCAFVVLAYAANVGIGLRSAAATSGTIVDASLHGPVFVRRDRRDVPHIAASSQSDLFFGQGFVEASDRLFQMDLARRFAFGTLAQMLGAKVLRLDERQRYYDVRAIVARQWHDLDARDRRDLTAFTRGVNAAIATQPLPVEYRLLLYRPAPWRPQDSLAVSLALSIALGDSWDDVFARDRVWRSGGAVAYDATFPLSDARYDVLPDGQRSDRVAWESPTAARCIAYINEWRGRSAPVAAKRWGSNAWAAGALRTTTGRALLANDPHLDLTIPGLWYVVDLRAPGIHVAGVSLPGTPGVVLGHNDRIAWGATNSDAASMTLFQPSPRPHGAWQRETFDVRFAARVRSTYYRTAQAFAVPDPLDGDRLAFVSWRPYASGQTSIATFLAVDRAGSAREATRVLSRYTGAAENFVVADTGGNVAYHVAGSIPSDPSWGRYVERFAGRRFVWQSVPFAKLPALRPSRDGIVVSANNKMYAGGYRYRLAPVFDPPYRAYRIAQLLGARQKYDQAYFARMQLDTVSVVDRELARRIARFAEAVDGPVAREFGAWNGAFSGASRVATVEHRLRLDLGDDVPSLYALLAQLRSRTLSLALQDDLQGELYGVTGRAMPWSTAGSVRVDHPLAPLRFGFLNGATLPGDGDEFSIHVQEPGFSQSFRAVWDVGNWNAGGIVIPSGESGEPGSGHYTDLTATWLSGRLIALPFTPGAVAAATVATLVLRPRDAR